MSETNWNDVQFEYGSPQEGAEPPKEPAIDVKHSTMVVRSMTEEDWEEVEEMLATQDPAPPTEESTQE